MAGAGIGLGDGTQELDKKGDRIQSGIDAGDNYTEDLETIRDDLDAADDSGTTLGKMVGSQLKMTEAEIGYQVKAGLPKKVSSENKNAAGDVKRAAG